MIKISMNGGWSKKDRPYAPVCIEEYEKEIEWFMEHGIDHFHIHFRDDEGIDTLDEKFVRPQFEYLKKKFPGCRIGVGSPLLNGRTSEIRYQQISQWTDWKPDYISLNVFEEGLKPTAELLIQKGVPIEYGLFDYEDIEVFEEAGCAETAYRVLIEISGEDALERVIKTYEYLHDRYPEIHYLVHGEDMRTWDIIRYAKDNNISWRVGFEDIDRDSDENILKSNVELYLHAMEV